MKVALISHQFPQYCVQLANSLAPESEVLLLLPHDASFMYANVLDRCVTFKPFHKPRLRQPLRQIWSIGWILRQISRFNPDIIHIQSGHLWLNLVLPLLRRRYPIVMTIHDVQRHPGDKASNTPEWISRLGYNCADQIIVHGEQLRQAAIDVLGFARANVHVMPQVPDIIRDDQGQEYAEIDNTILFFGRIWEYKGLEYLIKAEPLIAAWVPNARIVIAGQGEDFSRYQRMMINPERFVVYNTFISNHQRDELFQQASIVVLPYVEASSSAVIPVAYTFGRPVVATTVGSLPEMVDHGRTGLLVPPRDSLALADAVVQLLCDRELRREMGINASRMLASVYAPELVGHQTRIAYNTAIQGSRGRSGKQKPGPTPTKAAMELAGTIELEARREEGRDSG